MPKPNVFKANKPGQVVDPSRCAASVFPVNGWSLHQCHNKGKYDEDGHKWCGVHRPSKIKQRDDERAARWKAEDEARALRHALLDAYKNVADIAIAMFRQEATHDDLERAVLAYEKLEGETDD